jgi:hypothetical protein
MELGKDYRHYPFWDKSGDAIRQRFDIDLPRLARSDSALAADLYIYCASMIESGR